MEGLNNSEFVARAIFEPSMIIDGRIIDDAFLLRRHLKEDYISVVRLAVDSWEDDMKIIPTNKTSRKRLYGYAKMNVGEIKAIKLPNFIYDNLEDEPQEVAVNVKFDVSACDNDVRKSHAGIFSYFNGTKIVGGVDIENLPIGIGDDAVKLMIQSNLAKLAQKGLATY